MAANSSYQDILLVQHCHAVLAGLKIANYFCLPKSKNLERQLAQWSKHFADWDLKYKILCHCPGKLGIYIYNEELLAERLQDERSRNFLRTYGYEDLEPEAALKKLSSRLKCSLIKDCSCPQESFPHELGVFLGYPQADVESFISEAGKNYLYSGNWKVYHDVQAAKRCFDQYNLSLIYLRESIKRGRDLSLALQRIRAYMARRRSL
ncbi:MAG: DUF3793 family protein [Eubacteriales bacterium]|nr:DUF3793 family protein [Eubacteriales bacterium]